MILGIKSYFKKISEKYKSQFVLQVFYKFGILFLFTFIISILVAVYLEEELEYLQTKSLNSKRIYESIIEMRRLSLVLVGSDLDNVDFFKYKKTKNTEDFLNAYQNTISLILLDEKLEKKDSNFSEIVSDLNSIKNKYEQNLELYLERGFLDFGQEGRLRELAHRIEYEIKIGNNLNIFNLYLLMRRYEKDYILRGDEVSILKWRKEFSDLISAFSNSKVKYSQSTLQLYGDLFLKYISLDKTSRLAEVSLRKDFYEIFKKVDRILESKNLTYKKSYRMITNMIVLFPVCMMLLVLVMVFRLAHSFASPIRKLSHYSRSIINGDFGHEVNLNRTDEFSTLESSIKEMVNTLRLVNLQARMAVIGEVAANISHDIRNPLTIIEGNAKLLEKTLSKADRGENDLKINKYIAGIGYSTERIWKIIKSIQSLSHSKDKEDFEPRPLKQIVDDSILFVEEKAKSHNVRIEIVPISESIKIYSRGVQISQVIINLLNNAIEAICDLDDKWIQIKSTEDENHIFLIITDSGKGIVKELQDKLFSTAITTKGDKGTGIGLMICQKMALLS